MFSILKIVFSKYIHCENPINLEKYRGLGVMDFKYRERKKKHFLLMRC